MELSFCEKESFTVIGMEGSTQDGAGFIQTLWSRANERFGEVAALAKRMDNGGFAGFWGAMSDLGRRNLPWEDGFTKGLYLAGVEAVDGAEAPEGWTKWVIPSYEYAYTENDAPDAFQKAVEALIQRGTPLIGAAHDFNCPETGKAYIFLPIRRL